MEINQLSKQKIVKIIGETGNKIYALGFKEKEDYFLKIFDSKTMKLLSSNPIVIPQISDKEVDFEDVFLLNNTLYAIGSVYNKKEKISTFDQNWESLATISIKKIPDILLVLFLLPKLVTNNYQL